MDNFYASGDLPLSWVQAARGEQTYINVGDALSPYMLAMVSGRDVSFKGFSTRDRRIAAVGTIGQSFTNGIVDIWGAGCSQFASPLDSKDRRPYLPPSGVDLRLHATRGPFSARLLSGGGSPAIPYGDPAALLPRFYRPASRPSWDLGVVVHLAELADRSYVANPKPQLNRYRIPADLAGSVRLITMVAPDNIEGVRDKIDELLSCRRIVTTSLHGYAIAAAYGIPCLYIGSERGAAGLVTSPLDDIENSTVNTRFIDLLGGYGETEIVYYRLPRRSETDWDALMKAVDSAAIAHSLDEAALMDACPAGAAPLTSPPGKSIWDHPVIRRVPVAYVQSANPDDKPGRKTGVRRLLRAIGAQVR